MAASSTLRELWDTTRMRLLVEIERQGSVSAAAAAIGIGQPSASQHLRLLEGAAGQRLVERNGRGSRLTEAGHVLAVRAAQALATLGAAEEELDALAGLQTGTIHLGASTAPGVYVLPDTLGCFRRNYPGVTVEVQIAASEEILARLLAGRVQLALVGATRADERIGLDPFLEDEIVGVARPGLAPVENGVVEAARLATFTLLARERGSSSQQIVDEELRAIGASPAGVWELGSSEAIKRAAREGLGLAFLSRYTVAEEVERGDLERFRLAGRPPLVRHFSVARIAGRPLSPSERSFVDTLTTCCAKQADYAAACVGAPAGRRARATVVPPSARAADAVGG
jgi:LysR family transcriptional regulator, low CO2-responsive transcriptional regulator